MSVLKSPLLAGGVPAPVGAPDFANSLVLAIGGTSTATPPLLAAGAYRVVATVPCWVQCGDEPTASAGDGSIAFGPWPDTLYLPTAAYLAVIKDATAATDGHLSISPLQTRA